ncbi:MFS general substrate transporter [Thozetella sp. PMI_491]|nr:MFS general substrate transporter [Thozetella sp. PMI_491]
MEATKVDSAPSKSPDATSAVALPSDSDNDVEARAAEYVPGSKLEKQLLRKIDFYIMPTLWLMCVLAYVDRNNIGNAKAAGMSSDLGLTDGNYSMLISIFFVGYLIYEIPSNLILARVPPSWYLPSLMIAWGILVAGMSQVANFHAILVCRFFLGFIEAGFMPGVMFLMSCWYKKEELGKRFSIFFSALCIAGAVSGLLSGAIISGLEGAKGMRGWRWLFLLEGVITVFVAFGCKFILLDYPETSRRLTPEERKLAALRIKIDKDATAAQAAKMKLVDALYAALVDLRTYVFMALYLLDNGCATISYFIPTVLSDMGYSGTLAQWMTVPIWIVGTFFLVVVPQSSDRFRDRRWHVVFGFMLAFVSGIIIVTVKATSTRYAFICFYISGIYCAFPLILTWASETMSLPAEKRAVAIAAVNAVGNLAAIYGSYMWPSTDAPDYKRGFTAMVGMCGGAAILAAIVPILFKFMPTFKTEAERNLEVIDGQPERE